MYNENKKLIIVDGRKRIETAQELGISEIDALIITGDKYEIFRNKIYDSVSNGSGLNPVEISLILNKLVREFSIKKKEIIKEYFPVFHIKSYFSDVYFRIHKFDDSLKDYIIENSIPVNVIKHFFYFKPRELPVLYSLINSLKIKGSNLKIVLTYLEEVIRRDDIRLVKFLSESGINELLEKKKLTISQKLDKVKRILWEKRYPILFVKESEIIEKLRKFKIPRNIKLSIPSFLEGNNLMVNFSIGDKKHLQNVIEALKELYEDQTFLEVLDLL